MVFRDKSGKAILKPTVNGKKAGEPSFPDPISPPKQTGKRRSSKPKTRVIPPTTTSKSKFDSATGLPRPADKRIVTSMDLRSDIVKNIRGTTAQYSDIDPNRFYRLESGKIVTGQSIRQQGLTDIGKIARGVTGIRPGEYIEKEGQYYQLTPELTYVLKHAEPKESGKLYESIGKEKGVRARGFAGPIYTPFTSAFTSAYESLTPTEKTEYGYKYTPFINEPIEEWKYHPGGERYLKEHKEDVVAGYIEGKGGYKDFWKNVGASKLLEGAYKLEPEAYGGRKFATKSFIKEYAWDVLSLESQERKGKYFESLPAPAKWYSSGFHATASAAMFPITLPQLGVKLVTGKTHILPDVSAKLQEVRPGGPSGLITTGIEEGLEKAPWIPYIGGHETDAWERFKKDIPSGIFATGGELFGMWMGGKAASVPIKYGVGAAYKYTHIGLNKLKIYTYARRPFLSDTTATAIYKPKYPLTLSEYQASMYQKGMIWDYNQGGWTRLGQKSIVEQQLSTVPKRTVTTMTKPKTSLELHDIYPTYTKPKLSGFSLKTEPHLWSKVYSAAKVQPLTATKVLTYTLPMAHPLTKILTQTKPLTKVYTKTKPLTLTKVKPLTLTKVKPLTLTKVKVQPLTATRTKTLTKTLPQTQVQTETLTKTLPQTLQKTQLQIKTATKTKPKLLSMPAPTQKLGKKQGFNVYVKDRYIVHGKKKYDERYVKLSRTALSKGDALALGSALVDRSAAASFYIKPVKQKAHPLNMSIPGWKGREHKFYKRKSKTLKRDIFTEGTSFRIDTSGEVAEIPARGILARMEQTQGVRLFNQLKTSSKPMDSISRDYDKMMKKLMGAM